MIQKKIAVAYHYYESNQTYKDNLIYFLLTAIIDEIDYYIIIAGKYSVDLPTSKNITYIFTENKNNDYGGYVEFIKKVSIAYDYYFFINSSTRGPFLPQYYPDNWTEPFLAKFNPKTHLVGGSINLLPHHSPHATALSEKINTTKFIHIQTTAYAMTSIAMEHLKSIGFYNNERTMTKDEVIQNYEIMLSLEILKNGWQIATILPIYGNQSFTNDVETLINHSCRSGDTLQRNQFFSRTLNPLELIFIKTNRDLLKKADLASYTMTGLIDHAKSKELEAFKKLMFSCEQEIKNISTKRRIWRKIFKFFKMNSIINNLWNNS